MAERRMFAKTIIDSDLFLDMPVSSQNLYFHLCMRADDDGFINNPKKIQRMIGASEDDLTLLKAKQFIIPFDNKGIVVIKHWYIHNYIRQDRYKETPYIDEKSMLELDRDKSYKLADVNDGRPVGIPLDTQGETQDRLGKDRLDYINNKKNNKKKSTAFQPPTVDEVRAYCVERNNNIDAEQFVDFYECKGWYVGKNKMKDWKAAVRGWERRDKQPSKARTFDQRTYDYGALEKQLLNSRDRKRGQG